MPLSKYFGGHGEKVMESMKKKHGERGKKVFYATAKSKGMEPSDRVKKKHGVK
jgi:hypothetical protein